jgi:hypothetical protein
LQARILPLPRRIPRCRVPFPRVRDRAISSLGLVCWTEGMKRRQTGELRSGYVPVTSRVIYVKMLFGQEVIHMSYK